MSGEQATLSPQNIKLKEQLNTIGAVPFYEKCLTSSDTTPHGRVVVPKVRPRVSCDQIVPVKSGHSVHVHFASFAITLLTSRCPYLKFKL
jgi:hypothetical protein